MVREAMRGRLRLRPALAAAAGVYDVTLAEPVRTIYREGLRRFPQSLGLERSTGR